MCFQFGLLYEDPIKKVREEGAMKYWKLGCLLAAALPLGAQAGEGYYFGVEAGINYLDDQDMRLYYNEDRPLVENGTTIADVDYDDDWMGGLLFGYSFANGLRPELSIAYRTNDVDGAFLPSGLLGLGGGEADVVNGKEVASSLFANLWWDLFPSRFFHPYLGGGVGGLYVEAKDFGYDGDELNDDSDAVFAYQLGAGLGFDLSPQWTLSIDYRRVWGEEGEYNLVDDTPVSRVHFDYDAETTMLSLRYYFGRREPEAPPAPPPPPEPVRVVEPVEPPPPPPPPPCEPPTAGQQFTLEGCVLGDTMVLQGVNFEFDEDRLTLNAKTLLDQVAGALTKRSDIKIELEGHTDSKGSDTYNQALSEARAASVKRYLIERGVDGGRMSTVGYGETMPVADNTTDEGRELNRRVQLKVTASDR